MGVHGHFGLMASATATDLNGVADRGLRVVMGALSLLFEVARAQYAKAGRVGLINNSILASRDIVRVRTALENAGLEPWARQA